MKSRFFLTALATVSMATAACTAETGPETTGSIDQATTGCSAEWGQCGGNGWTGPTCCASGTTCVYSNAYYSQCLPSSSSSSSSASSSSSTSCPNGANDAQQRNAASAAYTILRAASIACQGSAENGPYGGPCWGTSLLNSQRYTVSGSSIALNTNDGSFVSQFVDQHPAQVNQIKAALAIAQLDSATASFLVQGLQWSQANTNGQVAAVSMPIEALASFTYPGNTTPIPIEDGMAAGKRSEVVTGSAWCNTEDIHFVDTSYQETNFAPFNVIPFSEFSEPPGNAPGFTGGNSWPSTPFNGPGGGSNPYLVISLNGSSVDWNSSSWPVENCPSSSCSGTIDFDPIPYTQPAPYYNANGLVGPESNPFTLVVADQWADASNGGNWATEIVGGTTHGGTFSNGVTFFGITVYGYVQQY